MKDIKDVVWNLTESVWLGTSIDCNQATASPSVQLFVQELFQTPLLKIDKESSIGASLVAQWLRICLLMQGTRVRALVWEDPTCRGATGAVSHNY